MSEQQTSEVDCEVELLNEFAYVIMLCKEKIGWAHEKSYVGLISSMTKNLIMVLEAKAEFLLACGRIQRVPSKSEQKIVHQTVNLDGASKDELECLERANTIYEKYTSKKEPS